MKPAWKNKPTIRPGQTTPPSNPKARRIGGGVRERDRLREGVGVEAIEQADAGLSWETCINVQL